MRRAAALAAAAASALATAPARAGSDGVYLGIDAGYALWNKDALKTKLGKYVQPDQVELLTERQMPDGGTIAFHLGYNINGYVAIEGNFWMHFWEPFSETRGGIGVPGLAVRWFPLQGLLRPNRQFDFSVFAGVNYFLQGGGGLQEGGNQVENSGRGIDGLATEFGGTIELYPSKTVSLGITPRVHLLDPARYFRSFNRRDRGGANQLAEGQAGNIVSINLSVTFHFEPIPD